MGQWLSERTGQQFIVENRAGAATNIATEIAVNAPADGYTLLLVGVAAAINATLYDNLSFNFMRDVAPVASIYRGPAVLVVHPSFPARSVPGTRFFGLRRPVARRITNGEPVMTIQYHSEASPGPLDNMYVFERFLEMVDAVRSR